MGYFICTCGLTHFHRAISSIITSLPIHNRVILLFVLSGEASLSAFFSTCFSEYVCEIAVPLGV